MPNPSQPSTQANAFRALRERMLNSPTALGFPALVALGLYFLITTLQPAKTPMEQATESADVKPATRLTPFADLLTDSTASIQAYASEVNTQRFNIDGKLQNSLEAESQLQIDETLVFLERPTIALYDEGDEEWTLSSNLGRLRHSAATATQGASDLLELLGDAELNPSAANESRMRLRAPSLAVDPRLEIVSSSERVEVIDTGLTQTAQGFEANLQTDTMQFNSAVRGNYEPPAH